MLSKHIKLVFPFCRSLVFSLEGEEAWDVLPISLVSGLSLLANNTALLYGGVAFVSMVHANVT